MGNRYLTAAILGCLAVVIGCVAGQQGSTRPTRLRLAPLYQGSRCSLCASNPAAVWIDSIRQLGIQHQVACNRHTGNTIKDPVLLLICMGRRPSGGFHLGITKSYFTVRNNRAILQIVWQEPGPGDLVAQAITSPCLLLALEQGPYHSLTVVDQHGIIRAVAGPPGAGHRRRR